MTYMGSGRKLMESRIMVSIFVGLCLSLSSAPFFRSCRGIAKKTQKKWFVLISVTVSLRQSEVNCFLQEVQRSEGQPIDIAPALSMAATNVICHMLMSVRFTKEDPLFQRFTFLIEEGMRLFGEVLMVEYLPAIQYLPGVINAKNKIQRNRQEMFDFYRKVINDHRETLDRDNVRDLVDMYLCEIEQAKEEGREGELFEGKDHGKSNDTGKRNL